MRTEIDILKSEIKNYEKMEDELATVINHTNHVSFILVSWLV